MLLKQFSHILENTKLTTSQFISDKYSSQHKVVKVKDISSKSNERYINSVSTLVNDATSSDADDDQNSNTITNANGHLMLSFDQTQMQTHIMSRYLQILCDKYGVKESDILCDISPIHKNNKLWLLYTFKFPKLQSEDSITINEFKEYVDQDDEYHIVGNIKSNSGSKIKVFISKSNEISTGPEMDAAIRTGAYTTWSSDLISGKDFEISVKYGCSVLFRADYCNDVILLNVHNNIKVNITLEYNDSLDNSSNNIRIEADPILNNTTSYVYSDPEQVETKYTYEHTDLQNVYVTITSMDMKTFQLYGSDNLELVLLESTSSEEYGINDSLTKEWSEVASFLTPYINKNSKNQYSLDYKLTTKLNSIKPKSEAFKYYKNNPLNNYITSLYLKPALVDTSNNERRLIKDVVGNIITLNYVWKIPNGTDITSLPGSGNRLVICTKNIPGDGLLRVEAPVEMELAYIYNSNENDKTVPNFIIPMTSNKPHYLSSDIWTAYNGYCDNTFNVRTAYCYNGEIHRQGNITSPVSFVIEYISYYIDKENPTYFYEQTLYLEGSTPDEGFGESTGNDIYDIKHKKLIVNNLSISGLTQINIISEINKKYYKKDENGELIIKDENGKYTNDGIINNYADNVGTLIRGTMLYESNNSFKIDINPTLLTNEYIIQLEDSNSNVIEDTATNAGFVYDGYLSTTADKFHLIKATSSNLSNTTANDNTAVQNIFPNNVHHLGVYTNDTNKMKIGQVSFDSESNFIDTSSQDNFLVRLGFLSDIHFDATDNYIDESADDLINAYKYFDKHNIKDIYCAGDLSVSDSPNEHTDLRYFSEYLNIRMPQEYPAATNMKLYVARGNHDIGCIYSETTTLPNDETENNIPDGDNTMSKDPNNPIITEGEEASFDISDREFIYKLDKHWHSYLQNNVTWDNSYYDPGEFEDDGSVEYVSDWNEDVAKATCGYNEYISNDHQFKLVIIALPLYSNAFWDSENGGKDAYENEELYKFECLLRDKYEGTRDTTIENMHTEIIVMTHLPFDDIYTGNYKSVYGHMNTWYNSNQYKLLKKIHDSYEGVIWMHGHTHFKYELQGEHITVNSYEPKPEGFFDNANISCVNNVFDIHISSGAYPRIVESDGTRSNCPKESQGLMMEVYKDHLIIKGIAFKTRISDNEFLYNKTVPVAMYRVNFITNKKQIETPIISYNTVTNTIEDNSSGGSIDEGNDGQLNN